MKLYHTLIDSFLKVQNTLKSLCAEKKKREGEKSLTGKR